MMRFTNLQQFTKLEGREAALVELLEWLDDPETERSDLSNDPGLATAPQDSDS